MMQTNEIFIFARFLKESKMKLNFHNASELDKNVKATVHKTGKTGFSFAAIKALKFDENRYMRIATNEDTEDKNLYVEIHNTEDKESFKIAKSGDYYYADTKALFDKLGLNYLENTIIYDITPFKYENKDYFKFIRREKGRKEKQTN